MPPHAEDPRNDPRSADEQAPLLGDGGRRPDHDGDARKLLKFEEEDPNRNFGEGIPSG